MRTPPLAALFTLFLSQDASAGNNTVHDTAWVVVSTSPVPIRTPGGVTQPAECAVRWTVSPSGEATTRFMESCPEALRGPVTEVLPDWTFREVHPREGQSQIEVRRSFVYEPSGAQPAWRLGTLKTLETYAREELDDQATPIEVNWKEIKVKTAVKPDFPREALTAGTKEATCRITFTIDERGNPEQVEVWDCPQVFEQSVLTSAVQWRFSPLELNGQPHRAIFVQPVKFVAK